MVHDHHKIDRKSKWLYLGCVDPANNESIFPFLLLLAVLLKPPAALFAWTKSNIGSVGVDSTDFSLCYSNRKCSKPPDGFEWDERSRRISPFSGVVYTHFYLISMLYCGARISWMGSLTQKEDSDCTGSRIQWRNEYEMDHGIEQWKSSYRQQRWINIKIHSTRKNCNATNLLK